jgi:two-component system repressor protein LuxO
LLLRFIESGVFRSLGAGAEASADVRIIASSNRDLLDEVRAGRLREDLYYRLQVLPIRLPPLRERLSDVAELASIMLNRLAVETGRSLEPLSGDAKARLLSYAWPGNVRQLENMLRWVATMMIGREIGPHIIDEAIAQFDSQSEVTSALVIDPESLDTRAGEVRPLWLVEKEAIQNAIEVSDGNINRAAILLEVAPSTIYRKVQAWKDG